MIAIDQALCDRNLLGASLDPVEGAKTWRSWVTILRAAAGIELDPAELTFFKSVSGDRAPPAAPVAETWIVVGRRSGKSRMAAAKAVHAALLCQHMLAPAFAALPQADQDEARAARVERREHKRARKQDMELARKIYALHDSGSTADEIQRRA